MSENVVILITGIGKGLVAAYLAAPGNTVIATVRDVSHPSSQALQELPKGLGSVLKVIQLDCGNKDSVQKAIRSLEISKLDIVVSNAGISQNFDKLIDVDTAVLQLHIEVNAYGPLWLIQETLPLLRKAANPKFLTISSGAGATSVLEHMGGMPMGVYGASKSLVNHLMKRLSIEVEDVIVWLMNPGCVETDIVKNSRNHLKLPESITVEQSVEGIVKIIGEATKETNGQFLNYDGRALPW
ncbi:hypothetical protein AK830_g8593 [Neonectria ditissima]|uniref:NAD(P)-binding protein n=1 Tax=Neonectria ditissima TaxID=78410 RepID=A0A0P7B7N9_9HYPO|nr:hypothetical protein AK830_g8593 [Neonectria ditissima]